MEELLSTVSSRFSLFDSMKKIHNSPFSFLSNFVNYFSLLLLLEENFGVFDLLCKNSRIHRHLFIYLFCLYMVFNKYVNNY